MRGQTIPLLLLQAFLFSTTIFSSIIFSAAPRAAEGQDPSATLDSINAAVQRADSEAFDRLVDVDGILDQTLHIFLKELNNPAVSDNLPPLLALMFSQAAQSTNGINLRAMLKAEGRAFVLNGIATGAFAGRKIRTATPNGKGLLTPLFADASTGRKTVISRGEPARSGNSWLLPFTVHDEGNGNDYSVTGRFAPGPDGRLRLVGIENLPMIMAKISSEAAR